MENRTTIQISEDLRKELRILASKRDCSYQELLADMIQVFKELDENKTIISLPKHLVDQTSEKINDREFSSFSSYVSFLLRSLLMESVDEENISEDEEKRVMMKLKQLGYLG